MLIQIILIYLVGAVLSYSLYLLEYRYTICYNLYESDTFLDERVTNEDLLKFAMFSWLSVLIALGLWGFGCIVYATKTYRPFGWTKTISEWLSTEVKRKGE